LDETGQSHRLAILLIHPFVAARPAPFEGSCQAPLSGSGW
jgi:hypothetical protein